MEKCQLVSLQIWSVPMISRYLWTDLGPFLGTDTLFWPPKLGVLITMEPGVHDVCNLSGLCCIMISKMWQFDPKIGLLEWGNFGSQKVRSVLNREIFNCFASNLSCAHDFVVSPPWKQERQIWGQVVPQIFFYPNYFFLPKFFFQNFFFL